MKLFGSERVNREGGEEKVRLRSLDTWLGGLMVVGLILATAGAVTAQSTGVITGCVQKQTGALRISTSGSCDSKTETVLTWNQQGPQGPQGQQGPQGPQGPSGVSGYTRVTNVNDDGLSANLIAPRSLETAHAECPEGKRVLGGGAYGGPSLPFSFGTPFVPGLTPFQISELDHTLEIKSSAPYETAGGDNGWIVLAFNHDFIDSEWVRVYAICADVTSP